MSAWPFLNFNGTIFPADEKIISAINRGLRYGDGLFETIRIHNSEILFLEDHVERMFAGLKALQIRVPELFSVFFFHKQIIDLAHKNQVGNNGRIRITIFREGDGLYEPQQFDPGYFIEIAPLQSGFEWNNDSGEIGIYRDIPKSVSSISFFKSLNALPYVMAAIFKKENRLNDCLLLNAAGNISDAISSNIFWVEDQTFFTVPVSEGGIAGIMRKNLIRILTNHQIPFQEKTITPAELKNADECFLTNVGWGMRPVTRFEDKIFSSQQTKQLFQLLMQEFEK